MLVKAVEAEVAAYIETHQHEVDENGRRLVVRNGHARERTLVSGVGQLKIQAPRVDDRRVDERGQRFRFTSEILPPYLRRTKSVEELIPWLYLKGISTGDFSDKPRLSNREREIVALVAQGFKNKEIAERMFISEQTVKNHLHNVFDKLGVSDRLELALYAIHRNIRPV